MTKKCVGNQRQRWEQKPEPVTRKGKDAWISQRLRRSVCSDAIPAWFSNATFLHQSTCCRVQGKQGARQSRRRSATHASSVFLVTVNACCIHATEIRAISPGKVVLCSSLKPMHVARSGVFSRAASWPKPSLPELLQVHVVLWSSARYHGIWLQASPRTMMQKHSCRHVQPEQHATSGPGHMPC